ncbi:MAG: hypothetical protein OK452_06595 [Thaumarchaeota archaeon]|nr:hypothetical protein [Nitrososphaerota archaeon]
MSNTALGASIKMLTFVPFALALFFYDIPGFTIISTNTYLPLFTLSLTLFAFGILLKARVMRTMFELSKGSFAWGAFLLGCSVMTYVYGSFTSTPTWYHYESLFFLIVSYTAFRIGTKVLRAIAPLLVIVAVSFAPFGVEPLQSSSLVVASLFYLYIASYLAYTGLRLKPMLLPVVFVEVGLVVWYLSQRFPASSSPYLSALVPVPILVLMIPRVRGFLFLHAVGSTSRCKLHALLPDGFCSLCGNRISSPSTRENFGPWGLVALGAVTFLLLSSSVPALALIGGSPYDATYSARGYSATPTLPTPAGWQVNSTTSYNNTGGNVFAEKKVYVPLVHPESKNYTLYYEVSNGIPVSSGPSGGELPGWNRTSNNEIQLGPLKGYLTVYTASGQTMLSFQGKTGMRFLSGSAFEQYYVGMGFVRIFKNTGLAPDTSQFLGDIREFWLPALNIDSYYSDWTGFLSVSYQNLVLLSPILILASSIGVIFWVATLPVRRDNRLDKILTLSSALPNREWVNITSLAIREGHSGTPLEFLRDESGSFLGDPLQVIESFSKLEKMGLARRRLVEAGPDIISVWKLPF